MGGFPGLMGVVGNGWFPRAEGVVGVGWWVCNGWFPMVVVGNRWFPQGDSDGDGRGIGNG